MLMASVGKLAEFTSQGETMEINGIAHIFLTASNFERSREFYRKLLPFLGLKPVMDNEGVYYAVGGRTGVAIRASSPEHAGAAFEQNRVGLHHLCFRARERADIDELHGFLCSLDVNIIRAPREDQWAPGYYSLLFEDPDGIRLELNHVPGKGLLVEQREFERPGVASSLQIFMGTHLESSRGGVRHASGAICNGCSFLVEAGSFRYHANDRKNG
jgi:catechol 2,3-dioxygenase-like lactoylglutathione lyase family enzyme